VGWDKDVQETLSSRRRDGIDLVIGCTDMSGLSGKGGCVPEPPHDLVVDAGVNRVSIPSADHGFPRECLGEGVRW
jgi:hypothetical protein